MIMIITSYDSEEEWVPTTVIEKEEEKVQTMWLSLSEVKKSRFTLHNVYVKWE